MSPAGPNPSSLEQYGFSPVTEQQLEGLQKQIEAGQNLRRMGDIDALDMELQDLVSQLDSTSGAQRQAVLDRATTVMNRIKAYDNGDDPGWVVETTRANMRGLASQIVTA